MDTMDVLIVGSGGREHALAWKLRQSPRCGRILAAPGNPGIAALGQCVPIPVTDTAALVQLARAERIGLVVVGPEAPLAAGLADELRDAGILVFGPSAAAARIESSKSYARDLMSAMDVPQPEYATFRDFDRASAYLDILHAQGARGAVVKASGLAAGKGAVVCETLDSARATARRMLEGEFGEASAEIVIEELLEGEEASLLVLTDGRDAVPLLPAQDYKRILDGDQGPNTGGMGCYAPAPVLTPELVRTAMSDIVEPTLRGLAEDGAPFQGCLYAGLMKTARGLKVIEFNCRFGDPETQVVLPLLDSDLLQLLLDVAQGKLGQYGLRWKDAKAVSVVMASAGYPASSSRGDVILGLPEAADVEHVSIFHAGTADQNGATVTAGGRVLNITGIGPTFAAAIDTSYQGVEQIHFNGMQYRRDIAARVREH